MKKRNFNFELLRVVAIATIIVLHYLGKGNILRPLAEDRGAANMLFWLMESFCIVTMNCYAMISGYFLVDAQWKLSKVGKLLCQVLFYSILIPVGLLAVGILQFSDVSVYDWATYIFPVGTECYWFVTAYMVMYLFAPILSAGIKHISKKQFQCVLGALLFLFCVEKTLIPIPFATDRYGYDFGWFLCLFLIAAYIRMYGVPVFEKKRNAWLIFVGCCLVIFLLNLGSAAAARTDIAVLQKYLADMPYTHNYVLCIAASVGLFYIFKNGSFGSDESMPARAVYRVASATMGIYLLHEHPLVRYRWPVWLQVTADRNVLLILLHILFCEIVLFACGLLAEMIRKWIFGVVRRVFFRSTPKPSRN